jgi:hypothetical protein
VDIAPTLNPHYLHTPPLTSGVTRERCRLCMYVCVCVCVCGCVPVSAAGRRIFFLLLFSCFGRVRCSRCDGWRMMCSARVGRGVVVVGGDAEMGCFAGVAHCIWKSVSSRRARAAAAAANSALLSLLGEGGFFFSLSLPLCDHHHYHHRRRRLSTLPRRGLVYFPILLAVLFFFFSLSLSVSAFVCVRACFLFFFLFCFSDGCFESSRMVW